jgi:DNA polymerase III sliding clamp (beta) subunit (PCNA family)
MIILFNWIKLNSVKCSNGCLFWQQIIIKVLFLRFNENKLVVTATNPDYGESKEETEIEFSGNAIEAAFNPKFFLDTLSVIDDENVI